MLTEEDQGNRIFACPQCPKVFATRSNLKRHMENPNIHNIPYVRSRDQKRWKGHSKKVISKEETTESNNDRMRKWRAENREKNRQNDLRCRVYRLARQKFGDFDSIEKQAFVREEIARRLGRRMMMERRDDWSTDNSCPSSPRDFKSLQNHMNELPFYSGSHQKIELPSIDQFTRSWSTSPVLPHLSPSLKRRNSNTSSVSSVTSEVKNKKTRSFSDSKGEDECCVLPSMHTFLSYAPEKKSTAIKYVESNKILDEFVGVVLNYVDNNATVNQ